MIDFPNPLLGFVDMLIDLTGLPVTFALLGTVLLFTYANMKIVKLAIQMMEE